MLCSPVPARPLVSMVRYRVARSPPDQNAVSNFSAWRRERPITWLLRKMTAQEATEAATSSATTPCTMGLASSTRLQTDRSFGIPPLREKILGDGTWFQRTGIETGDTHSGIDQLLVAPQNRLLEVYCGTRQTRKSGRDENFIMQHCGPQEIHADVDHDKLQLPFRAQPLLVDTHGPQPIGPATLHELQIICVVHHAAHVRIFVIHPVCVGVARRWRHYWPSRNNGRFISRSMLGAASPKCA